MVFGIIVYMYPFDNNRHKLPHIHAFYSDQEAVLSIPDGNVLDGNLPINRMKLLQAWMVIHQDELMADWTLAIEGQRVFSIDPLK
jgi:hypothetical protein